VDSDDALSALAAKHISEGKLPPVYHYGQEYLGTFAYHIYALMFKIFGYSILVVLLVSFIFYLAFIITQFIFFKDIFASSHLSLILCLFYCLPIGHLLAISFYISNSFSLVLFLGSLSMYISFLIYKKDKENLISFLGFCLGLLFWIHQITIYFAICSFILVFLKLRFKLKKYINLAIYFLIGSFPFVLYEIFNKISTFKFLFSGTKIQSEPWEKIKAIINNMIYLIISGKKNFFNFIYIFLIFLGIIAIIYLSFKKKKFLPENIFIVFFIVFIGVYTFSKFNVNLVLIRYLYPLYFALPVLLVSIFNLLRKKFKYILMLVLFLIILIFHNIRETYANYLLVKPAHFNLKKIISAMEMTGERYWAGEFWNVILITALSGEKIIGYSYSLEDYFPYKLWYFNHGENNNYVFSKEATSWAVRFKEIFNHIAENFDRYYNNQANNLIDALDRLNVKAKKEKIGDYGWMIYEVSGHFLPWTIKAPLPQQIPEIELKKIESSRVYLSLTFRNKKVSEVSGFRLHIGIPGYSSMVRGFSLEKEEIKMRIPFPRKKFFKIKYYLDYQGLKIQPTAQEVSYSPSAKELRKRKKKIEKIVYLSGFSPGFEVNGKKMRVCEKEVKFEINKKLEKRSKVRLHLYSPFQFSLPYWYGEYFQEVKIYINKVYLGERRLEDGENVIEFEMGDSHLKKRANVITLEFKYHLPFGFARLWKTAALLDKVEVD